jgi:hypothetical protein
MFITVFLFIAFLSLFWPVFRFCIGLLVIYTFLSLFDHTDVSSASTVNYSNDMTYEQLKTYPTSCLKKTKQLDELNSLLASKNFNSDPEKLSESDRIYNSRLKATIWWYTYSCE